MESLGATDPASVGGYPLFARLGAGGMGQVYLARTRAGRPLALKTVRSEFGLDPAFGERFAREIRHADRVRSPWTVTVVDFSPAGARPQWLATEYVAAPSLADWVAGAGAAARARAWPRWPPSCARRCTRCTRTGLAHRDVKPSNVLLPGTRPLLIDFGIARAAEDSRHTSTGGVIGSPGYMAPEQATAGMSAEPGDVFALGAVLVYAATGRGPFNRLGETPSAAALLYRVVHEEPDLAGVPESLQPLVRACLAKRPEDRPTALAAADLLAEADRSSGLWATRRPPGLAAELAAREAAMRAALGEEAAVSLTHPVTTLDSGDPGHPSVPGHRDADRAHLAGPPQGTRAGARSRSRSRDPDPRDDNDSGGQDPADRDAEPPRPRPARRRIVPIAAAGGLAAATLVGLLAYNLLDSGSDDDGPSGGSGTSTTTGRRPERRSERAARLLGGHLGRDRPGQPGRQLLHGGVHRQLQDHPHPARGQDRRAGRPAGEQHPRSADRRERRLHGGPGAEGGELRKPAVHREGSAPHGLHLLACLPARQDLRAEQARHHARPPARLPGPGCPDDPHPAVRRSRAVAA